MFILITSRATKGPRKNFNGGGKAAGIAEKEIDYSS
jgi:hypothetical protein